MISAVGQRGHDPDARPIERKTANLGVFACAALVSLETAQPARARISRLCATKRPRSTSTTFIACAVSSVSRIDSVGERLVSSNRTRLQGPIRTNRKVLS